MQEDLDELRRLLAGSPYLERRTRAMLAGDLPCPDLDAMAQEVHLNLRVPRELLERIEALLIEKDEGGEACWASFLTEKDTSLSLWARPTRSAALRLTLLRGFEALERQAKRARPEA